MNVFVCDDCFAGGEEKCLGQVGKRRCESCGRIVDTATEAYHFPVNIPVKKFETRVFATWGPVPNFKSVIRFDFK